MDMVGFFFALLNCCTYYIVPIIGINTENALRERFDYFKQKYNKEYKSQANETLAYFNFAKNWKAADDLNNKDTNNVYIINKFADLDPVDFEDHYGVTIEPYENEMGEDMVSKFLRVKGQQKQGTGLKYDLNDSENLYKEFLTKYNKTESKSKTKRNIAYLRFVKTLAELNRLNFISGGNKTYDINANVVKHPKQIFY